MTQLLSYILAFATTIAAPLPSPATPDLVHVSLNCSSVTPAYKKSKFRVKTQWFGATINPKN